MQTHSFNAPFRSQLLGSSDTIYTDLLIIGGGVTGAGIALDAALRNIKTVLVEKNDFASGTSSRSTKLIHGGLRYLKQMEFKLVRDVGRERAVLYKNALHIVRPEKMLLPIFRNGSLGKKSSSLGLLVYDLLAGVEKNERRKMLDSSKTFKAEHLLKEEGLVGGGLYYEYRTDDARLVIELIKSANKEGAMCLNYLEATEIIYNEQGKITGINATDKITGKKLTIHAKCVINACGPSVDIVRKIDNSLYGKRLLLTKGVHIVVPFERLPLAQAVYFDVQDGRMIFAIPRDGKTYIGTTDTLYNQDIESPLTTADDVAYLLAATNNMFPKVNLKSEDVESSWAGLRPLIFEEGKGPSELSRKDEIIVSETGMLSIAGGKLTGYRLMAEKIVNMAQAALDIKPISKSKTINYKLSGCSFDDEKNLEKFIVDLVQLSNIPPHVIRKWVYKYGDNTTLIIQNLEKLLQDSKQEELAYLLCELDYAIDYEMVLTAEDFIIRRSAMLYFDIPMVKKYLNEILAYMTEKLGWSEAETLKQKTNILQRIREATEFV